MHVLTIHDKKDGSTVEIHTLNPGDHIETFGGSTSGLTAVKTASIIHRQSHPAWGTTDTEIDIYNARFWAWMRDIINARSEDVEAS